MHDIYKGLVGKPYATGGRGPEAYDCYGLVMEIHKRRGITLPDYESPEDFEIISQIINREKILWEECEEKPGAVILIGGKKIQHHVATYLGFGKIIHVTKDVGSVSIDRLNFFEKRIVGFYQFKG